MRIFCEFTISLKTCDILAIIDTLPFCPHQVRLHNLKPISARVSFCNHKWPYLDEKVVMDS